MAYTDDDLAMEREYARRERNANKCQCRHMDMPGRCPGPAFCPMAQAGSDDEPDQEEEEEEEE